MQAIADATGKRTKGFCPKSEEKERATLFLKGINSISSKLLKMNKEYGSKLLGFYNVTSGILAGIIVECVRRNRAVKFGKNEKTVTDIIEYVDKNFSSALTAEAVAAGEDLLQEGIPGYAQGRSPLIPVR